MWSATNLIHVYASVLGGRTNSGLISLCNSGCADLCGVCAFSAPKNETRLLKILRKGKAWNWKGK